MFKRGLIAGVANLLVGFGLNFVFQAVAPSLSQEYANPALFRPWTDPLMMLFFAYPFILGFVAAYFWDIVEEKLKGEGTKKAFEFTKLYFVIATIPGMFVSYTTFPVSLLMILSWTIAGLAEVFVSGYIFTKVK